MFILKKTHIAAVQDLDALIVHNRDKAEYLRDVLEQTKAQLMESGRTVEELRKLSTRQAKTIHGYVREDLVRQLRVADDKVRFATETQIKAKQGLVDALNAKRSPAYANNVLEAGTKHNNALNHLESMRKGAAEALQAIRDHDSTHVV